MGDRKFNVYHLTKVDNIDPYDSINFDIKIEYYTLYSFHVEYVEKQNLTVNLYYKGHLRDSYDFNFR